MNRILNTKKLGFNAPQNEQIELALSFGYDGIHLDLTDFSRQVAGFGLEMARRLIDRRRFRWQRSTCRSI